MKNLGYQISEDGATEYRNNGGTAERLINGKWENVAWAPCFESAKAFEADCIANGYGYAKHATSEAAAALGRISTPKKAAAAKINAKVKTPLRAATARANGAKGGRPAPVVYAEAKGLYWASFDGQETFCELSDSESPDTRTAYELGEWLRVPARSVPRRFRELAGGWLEDREAEQAGREAQREAGL